MVPVILFEDEHILVIEKPAGMIVNRSDTTQGEVTLQDWSEKKIGIVYSDEDREDMNDFYKRGGIVHRLDKETSGILLLGKSPEAFVALQQQFKDRTVHKTYIALAHGIITPATGEIRVPVGRLPWDRKRFGIVAGGREAVTRYKTQKIYHFLPGKNIDPLTLLELYPETGRTHQIRVHLKYINRPIYADFLYAGRKTSRDDRKYLPRVFLHAAKITFRHPVTLQEMTIENDLPKELSEFMSQNLVERL